MELKDYHVQPDEGLFENINRRLRVRRVMRVGGVAAIVCIVAAGVWALSGSNRAGEPLPNTAPEVAEVTTTPTTTKTEKPVEVASLHDNEELLKVKPTVPDVAQRQASATHAESFAVATSNVSTKAVPVAKPSVVKPLEVPTVAAVAETLVASQPDAIQDVSMPEVIAESVDELIIGNPVEPPLQYDNIVWAPTIIVPSGDIDENRFFSLSFSSDVSEFRVSIYNRAGSLVFSSSDPNFVWDATASGVQVPQGAYVWVVKFRDSDNRPRQEKGTVTVIR